MSCIHHHLQSRQLGVSIMHTPNQDLADMATAANIDPEVVEDLRAQQIMNPGLLANYATSFDEVDKNLSAPYEAGVELAGKTYKIEDGKKNIFKAALRFLWKSSTGQFNAPRPVAPPSTPAFDIICEGTGTERDTC